MSAMVEQQAYGRQVTLKKGGSELELFWWLVKRSLVFGFYLYVVPAQANVSMTKKSTWSWAPVCLLKKLNAYRTYLLVWVSQVSKIQVSYAYMPKARGT